MQWGLEHRELGTLRAIGVDEIHIGQSHKFLTLVHQIEADCVRLLWVGKDRTKLSFEKFFTLIGDQLAGKVEFVCSDVCLSIRRPYLEVIAKHCPQALNILDRFHMVAKLNKALDEVRASPVDQLRIKPTHRQRTEAVPGQRSHCGEESSRHAAPAATRPTLPAACRKQPGRCRKRQWPDGRKSQHEGDEAGARVRESARELPGEPGADNQAR